MISPAAMMFVAVLLSEVDLTRRRADIFCEVLTCPPIDIVVEADGAMRPGIAAFVTRSDSRCIIHFRRQYLSQVWVIAHEVCHCAQDRDETRTLVCQQKLLENRQQGLELDADLRRRYENKQ